MNSSLIVVKDNLKWSKVKKKFNHIENFPQTKTFMDIKYSQCQDFDLVFVNDIMKFIYI